VFAILRGANGRRHEVDFEDDPVIVDVSMSSSTVQITMTAADPGDPAKSRYVTVALPRDDARHRHGICERAPDRQGRTRIACRRQGLNEAQHCLVSRAATQEWPRLLQFWPVRGRHERSQVPGRLEAAMRRSS